MTIDRERANRTSEQAIDAMVAEMCLSVDEVSLALMRAAYSLGRVDSLEWSKLALEESIHND